MTNPFVFLVGCPRSGTTLLRRIVDAHPRVAVTSEIGWIARTYEERDGLTSDGLVTPAFLREMAEKRRFGRYAPLPVERGELEALSRPGEATTYAGLMSWLFDRYGDARGKGLVGNKTVDLVRSIPTLHELWPRAKFVHLIRDGRDVCLSVFSWRRAEKIAARFASWRRDPVSTAALWWEWQVRLGREAGHGLKSDLYHEVRYESLVSRPQEECAALCDFLGFPYDEAMLRFHEGRRKADPGLDAKHAWLPPTPGLRDWRTQMPPEDVQRFEAVAGDLFEELDYPRGAPHVGADRLKHASRLRAIFEGRPLPERWAA